MNHRQGSFSNRRKLARIAIVMPARVRIVSGIFGRGRAFQAEVLDYNRFGCALKSERSMPLGRRLVLDLNAGHFIVRHLPAEVVSSARIAGGFRIGVRFFRRLGALTNEASPALAALSGLEESLQPQGQPSG